MTNYHRTVVESPEEAFDRLEEEFFVEERAEDEITLIVEGGGPPNDPVFEIIQEMGLVDQYSAHGKGIRYQEDLPEELRDESQHQKEQERATAANNEWSDEEVVSTLNVLEVMKENESDSDHINTLKHAQNRLQEIYGEDLKPITPDPQNVYESDVQTAIDLLSSEGVEYGGRQENKHPNNVLHYALEYIEYDFDGAHGVLPEPDH